MNCESQTRLLNDTYSLLKKSIYTTMLTAMFCSNYVNAGIAIVLPGLHEDGYDLQNNTISSADVIDWEITNADIVFGAYENVAYNSRVRTLGYMNNQILDFNPQWREDAIRNTAELNGVDYEDFFLHFSEDTVLAEVDPYYGEDSILNRKPLIVGYTASADHSGFWLYQDPNWDADVFKDALNGGALYIYHSEQFDRLRFDFSQFAGAGHFTIEYPSQINSFGQVTQWQSFDINKDNTRSFTRNQNVIWEMPEDWIRATTSDGSGLTYGGGQFFANQFIRDGGRLYVVRVKWHSDNIATRPRLNNIRLEDSFKIVQPAGAPDTDYEGQSITQWRLIKGFDTSADTNNDNYLSHKEFRKRKNKNATARFRWESRVIPFGKMWSQKSSWALTNVNHPDFANAIYSHYAVQWAEKGLNGAYNDDTNKLIGKNQFTVFSGGRVEELGLEAGSDEAEMLYSDQFSSLLSRFTDEIPDALIGLNVGTANLFGRNGQNELIDAGSVYLREHYLFPSTGFSGYAGLSKYWDNSVIAADGRNVIFQGTTRYGRVQYFGNTEENWKKDQYSTLAQFYLNNHEQLSYFHQWNNGYIYGSDNTTEDNFWKADIAKNIAYQPTQLLAVELGNPANNAPDNADLMPLMLSTSTPEPSDYTIVGNSASEQAIHPDLPGSAVYVKPTYTYFAYRSANNVIPGAPVEMVLAREFENGRVLYRTDFGGKNPDYFNAPTITIDLAVPMRPVDANGNIGAYVSQIEIGGYEGLFLLY